MNEAIPGARDRRFPPPAFAPVVLLSRAALVSNIRAALTIEGAGRLVDVRRDGWGYGEDFVTRGAVAAGADGVLTDQDAAPLASGVIDPGWVLGLSGEHRGRHPQAVMGLRGRVLSVKELRAGEGVSYGYTYRAKHDTRVALVTGGYAQGVVRSLGNRISVAIGEGRFAIAGRVAMDVSVVEVGTAEIARGDDVVFFGDPAAGEPSIAAWSEASGFTVAEIAATVGQRAAIVKEIP
ncbi:alanine racemase C-terminal domain-containing protein [Microbacterium sp. P04]|uniref:alanine racemase C-terminal domain-containing protein n=1 Tax=Microbacterium sp. P04 TaxID=3366947 RepID=UPI0037459401